MICVCEIKAIFDVYDWFAMTTVSVRALGIGFKY